MDCYLTPAGILVSVPRCLKWINKGDFFFFKKHHTVTARMPAWQEKSSETIFPGAPCYDIRHIGKDWVGAKQATGHSKPASGPII